MFFWGKCHPHNFWCSVDPIHVLAISIDVWVSVSSLLPNPLSYLCLFIHLMQGGRERNWKLFCEAYIPSSTYIYIYVVEGVSVVLETKCIHFMYNMYEFLMIWILNIYVARNIIIETCNAWLPVITHSAATVCTLTYKNKCKFSKLTQLWLQKSRIDERPYNICAGKNEKFFDFS